MQAANSYVTQQRLFPFLKLGAQDQSQPDLHRVIRLVVERRI